ncbi:MAG: cupredoxin domain-containing protein [Actinomycetota bacterium]
MDGEGGIMRGGSVRLAVALIALGLLGAACAKSVTTGTGSSGSSTPTKSASGAPVTLSGKVNDKGEKDATGQGQVVSVSIEAHNEGSTYYFDPTFIKAKPGAQVTVKLENAGDVPHNFSIEGGPGINQDLAKGQEATLIFTLPSSGVVTFFCEYHRSFGMQGAFYFTPGQTAPATTTTPTSAGGGYGY